MRRATLLACILALSALAAAQEQVRVVGISDGDTVTVLTARREQIRVRLHGIDAPESGQPFGTKSRQWLSDQVFGKTVELVRVDTDQYGRIVGRLRTGGKDVNVESVKAGMAWWYQRYARTDRKLEEAEREAKSARRGLWSEPNPTAPWDWRRPG